MTNDDTDDMINDAIRDLIDDDTRTWTVLTGNPDGTINVHMSPGATGPNGQKFHPPYASFAAELMYEMIETTDGSPHAAIKYVGAVLAQRINEHEESDTEEPETDD